MKILLIHADFIEYEPKEKAIKDAEEIEKKKVRVEDCLVVFSSAEEGDKEDVSDAVKEIKNVASQVKANRIVIYPFVHLTSKPAPPKVALAILESVKNELSKEYETYRAPFGWYKAFDISCKGHPLSELSREITIGRSMESEALKNESKMKSEWFIIDTDGKMNPISIDNGVISGYTFENYPKLQKLVKYEMAKNRNVDKEPPHIKLMKKLDLVGYEEGSDPGHFRYLPKGRLVKSLMEDFVTRKTIEYGGMEVETPIMYDYEHPALKSYLNRFPARQYTIETPNKKVFLRFAACFGQFLMAKDAMISYRNLPMRLYELTRYSFRVEQRGELAGLRRLRAFTMPDCHCFVKDFDQAKEEMMRRFELSKIVNEGFGLTIENDLEFAVRVTKEFFDEHKDFVISLIKKWGKPALVEIWDKRFFYFVLKYEWNFIDALDKASTLTTDQIDVENAERYGIQFTDSDNTKKFPLILHLSPSGAIERVIYSILEKAQMEMDKGKNVILPLWLSPTQVRLCPVNDTFIDYCNKLADEMQRENIRVDVDDRPDSIGKKIRDAEMEWTPYIVVIGQKEVDSNLLSIRIRE